MMRSSSTTESHRVPHDIPDDEKEYRQDGCRLRGYETVQAGSRKPCKPSNMSLGDDLQPTPLRELIVAKTMDEDLSCSVGFRRYSGAKGNAGQHRCHHPRSIQSGESGRLHQRCGVVIGYDDGLLLDL